MLYYMMYVSHLRMRSQVFNYKLYLEQNFRLIKVRPDAKPYSVTGLVRGAVLYLCLAV